MNIKIRGKMIYSHILIALIPFCLVGMLGVIISTREAEKNPDGGAGLPDRGCLYQQY